MARNRRFRFGLPTVFAGRPSVGGVGLGCQPILPDSVLSESKSPRRIFRRGLNSCDDEDMPVICPTCQLFDAEIAERRAGGRSDCYSFIAVDFHCLLPCRSPGVLTVNPYCTL